MGGGIGFVGWGDGQRIGRSGRSQWSSVTTALNNKTVHQNVYESRGDSPLLQKQRQILLN